MNNEYVEIYNNVHQPESFNSNRPIQLATNSQTQSHTQSFRPHATSFSLDGNIDMML